MKKQKLKLSNLKVQSFVTALYGEDLETIKGGLLGGNVGEAIAGGIGECIAKSIVKAMDKPTYEGSLVMNGCQATQAAPCL